MRALVRSSCLALHYLLFMCVLRLCLARSFHLQRNSSVSSPDCAVCPPNVSSKENWDTSSNSRRETLEPARGNIIRSAFSKRINSLGSIITNELPLHERRLQERMYRYSIDSRLNLIRTQNLGTVVPVALAASELEKFYQDILDKVITVWGLTPPESFFALVKGRLRLSLVSSNGETIPWAFLAGLVKSLLGQAQEHFTPVFSSFWQTDDQLTNVFVTMEVLDKAPTYGIG